MAPRAMPTDCRCRLGFSCRKYVWLRPPTSLCVGSAFNACPARLSRRSVSLYGRRACHMLPSQVYPCRNRHRVFHHGSRDWGCFFHAALANLLVVGVQRLLGAGVRFVGVRLVHRLQRQFATREASPSRFTSPQWVPARRKGMMGGAVPAPAMARSSSRPHLSLHVEF